MTTEIAVVNRLGVALATDSAVTISGGGKSKVFDTGDKLFELGSVDEVPDPESGGSDKDEAEVAVGGLVVSGGQSAAVLEL